MRKSMDSIKFAWLSLDPTTRKRLLFYRAIFCRRLCSK